MTSTVGGGRGSPKSRQKEQNQLISVCDKGRREGVKKSEFFAEVIYGSPVGGFVYRRRSRTSHPR